MNARITTFKNCSCAPPSITGVWNFLEIRQTQRKIFFIYEIPEDTSLMVQQFYQLNIPLLLYSIIVDSKILRLHLTTSYYLIMLYQKLHLGLHTPFSFGIFQTSSTAYTVSFICLREIFEEN